MSVSFIVILALGNEPNTSEMNVFAEELNHEISFEEGIELSKHSGFLPAKMSGEDAGFELFVYPAEELVNVSAPDNISDGIVYELSVGGNELEFKSAAIATVILSSKFNGIVFDIDTASIIPEYQVQEMLLMLDDM